jgi:hypothetical protein
MVTGAFFIPSRAFDGWARPVLTAIAAAVTSGVLLRIRGLWRWVALLVVPSLIFWAVATLVIFVVFMVFLPDGFIGG